jgi:hypothetical protein
MAVWLVVVTVASLYYLVVFAAPQLTDNCSDSPSRQRSHIKALWVSVYWILVRYFICNALRSTMRV